MRLNQVEAGEHFILLPGSLNEAFFYQQTFDTLLKRGATAEYIDARSTSDEAHQIFVVLQHLYEMSWHLAVKFINEGGERISHQGV